MSSNEFNSVDHKAAKLLDAWRQAHPIGEQEVEISGLSEGYEVQRRLFDEAIEGRRRPAGWKVGLTSPAAMAAFGADEPMVGRIFADTLLPDGATLDPALTCDPKVEGELLIEVDHLPDKDCGDEALLSSIRSVRSAIEIADSRIDGWPKHVALATADNACCGWLVLPHAGRPPAGLDLPALEMFLEGNGSTISQGSGANCMGSPLAVYRWFLLKAAAEGWPVNSGDSIMTGAMGPAVPMQPGTQYEAKLAGLGSVRLTFGKQQV